MTSLYKQSIPVFVKYLGNLAAVVEKGRKFADEKGIPHEKMITHRLIEDMRPLDYQVQSCCNTAKMAASRMSGATDVFFADDEKTFEDLQTRIAETIELLEGFTSEQFEGKEEKELIMESKAGDFRFTGQSYLSEFAIPNFHFHLTTAYCLLRQQGVPLTAFDYLRGVMVKA